jgi:hypothetical protein
MPAPLEEQVIETLFVESKLNTGVSVGDAAVPNGFAVVATFNASTSWVIVYRPVGI